MKTESNSLHNYKFEQLSQMPLLKMTDLTKIVVELTFENLKREISVVFKSLINIYLW